MNINRLSWDDLRVFLAVSRAGSFSNAGRSLCMDHATVGRRVSALEFAMETPLFERDRHGCRLNSQGRMILAHVEAIEANLLSLTDTLENGTPAPAGHVRVATMEGIASLYLSEQFARFKEVQPSITIELVTSSHDVRISQREADIFLSFFEPHGLNLEVSRIGRFPLHLYASADYLGRHGTPISVDAFRNHAFVGYIDDLIQLDAVRWLDEAIAGPAIAFYSSSMLAQMFAAVAGAGIVMLPAFARAERFGLVPVLPQLIQVNRDVWVSTHQYLSRLPRIKIVLAFLKETFAMDFPL
ncbi:LysR family transcriptional regulator [Paraburkholderia sp. BL21I4N1]|uniref:LysR family transcriptional regulator n=1 Tax=Paraburkholderia sp. BL21I4N1 TaxID=1938801 RepID=UPI000CFBD8BA|nr:LysR family transcriptional regulator [Paraburkholderia sp. BL21I4N1]PQV44478.1 DNA-binding transcriptional LysR family regulator [Paraburkholderia sp. BL21I4N1]